MNRDVRDAVIRARVAAGESQASVARAYLVTRQRVGQIIHRPPPSPPPATRFGQSELKPVVHALVDLLSVKLALEQRGGPKAARAQSSQQAPVVVHDTKLMAKCLTQLKMTSAMLAYRAAMAGVPAPTLAAITGKAAPDPFVRLVPYLKAMVALKTVEAKYVR